MYITSLRKNQSMQIKEITKKKKKGKMLVYEETRQKQKKKDKYSYSAEGMEVSPPKAPRCPGWTAHSKCNLTYKMLK